MISSHLWCDFIKRSFKVKENLLVDMSLDFAVDAVNICDSIKGHGSIRDQMMRSATRVGANIREANYARSKTDFAAKLQIALKECYETEFWIELFEKTKLVEKESLTKFKHDCGTIRRMLIASINTVEKND